MNDTTTAAAAATTAATATTTTEASAWHTGMDATDIGLLQNKGWFDDKDPKKSIQGVVKAYREVERFVGAPPDEMLRIPKPNAATTDLQAYWERGFGVPKESKDYDLSTVKRADGKDVDTALVDAFRAAAHSSRVPKDQAAPLLAAVVKQLDAEVAAKKAADTAHIKEQRETLDRNWGTNKAYNTAIAERALTELAKAAGVPEADIRAAADALSTVGGIGSSYVWEMFRIIGSKMGEAPFVSAQPGNSSNPVMSREAALSEINSLKMDRGFYTKLMAKDQEATRRWSDLHKIAFAA